MRYKILFIVSIALIFSISSCDLNEQYPSLKIVNDYDSKTITSVALVGYEFSGLSIGFSSSQTFLLDKGMPGGCENLNVLVSYGSGTAIWYIDGSFDFNDGEVTTITLKGSDAEGDPYYNNILIE